MPNDAEGTPALAGHSFRRGRIWIVLALAAMLIAGHGFMLFYAASHMALSAGLVGVVVLLVVIKHLGLFGPAFALFRRHRRKR